jgi:exodeoxyribonuclease V gamma subunit
VSEPLSEPYRRETIVVPSLGMERWLVSELSRKFGVWTNAEHPLPRAFIDRLFRALLGSSFSFEPWDKQHLGFSIARCISDNVNNGKWPPILRYLEGDSKSERSLELGFRIADAFDQYLVYRPDWIEAWQRGQQPDARIDPWQPELFRELVLRLGQDHFASRYRRALDLLNDSNTALDLLPERLCCFQVGLQPPAYLQLLQALGRRIPTHLFVLSPSREYENLCRRARKQLEPGAVELPSIDERIQQQPLFASLCRQACHLDEILANLPDIRPGIEEFVESEPRNVLELVQTDICALNNRDPLGTIPRYELSPKDRSIEIHACHSHRREVEVLREVLLDIFDGDQSLAPEEVLVMLADIDAYAPLVDAVFGARDKRPGYIPYTIADRSLRSFNSLADFLLQTLEILSRRMTVERLLDLLSFELIQRKFELGAPRLSQIEKWLTQLQIHWGCDGSERQASGLPPLEDHTLRFGLSRLLLGVALDSKVAPVYAGRAPLDVEGEDAELAGRVAQACETLLEFRSRLSLDQPLQSYALLLTRMLDEVFHVEHELLWQRTEIVDSLGELESTAREAGFTSDISFYSLRQFLRGRFEATPSARSFLSGGVTFCRMLPLRSIPFRVIAMVGLQDEQFPRHASAASFNALAQNVRRGDRNISDEDRFLFAETLLACRDRLIITYVGRSSRDDSARPPSVVVDELMQAIDESCQTPGDCALTPREIIHCDEALQPFSPRYFDGSHPRLVNRSEEHYRGAVALDAPAIQAKVPDYGTLSQHQPTKLNYRDLTTLLRYPARLYLEKSLRLAANPKLREKDNLEPITLDALSEWHVTSELLDARLQGRSEASSFERLRAAGELPLMGLGNVVFDSLRRRADGLFQTAAPYFRGQPLEDKWLSLKVDGVQIEGWIKSIWPAAHVQLQASRLKIARTVEAWVEHLCLNASGDTRATVLIARGAQRESVVLQQFEPVSPAFAQEQLASLVKDYRLACTAPIPFWLDPAQIYFNAKLKGLDHATALQRAQSKLDQMRADGQLESHFDILYGPEPCADDWPTLAHFPQSYSFSQWVERWIGPIYQGLSPSTAGDFAGEVEVTP